MSSVFEFTPKPDRILVLNYWAGPNGEKTVANHHISFEPDPKEYNNPVGIWRCKRLKPENK